MTGPMCPASGTRSRRAFGSSACRRLRMQAVILVERVPLRMTVDVGTAEIDSGESTRFEVPCVSSANAGALAIRARRADSGSACTATMSLKGSVPSGAILMIWATVSVTLHAISLLAGLMMGTVNPDN